MRRKKAIKSSKPVQSPRIKFTGRAIERRNIFDEKDSIDESEVVEEQAVVEPGQSDEVKLDAILDELRAFFQENDEQELRLKLINHPNLRIYNEEENYSDLCDDYVAKWKNIYKEFSSLLSLPKTMILSLNSWEKSLNLFKKRLLTAKVQADSTSLSSLIGNLLYAHDPFKILLESLKFSSMCKRFFNFLQIFNHC